MAWTDPRTWVNNEVLTFTNMNTHVRDNMRELWHEVNYTEFTSSVAVTATTEGTATTIVSSGAITYVANPILIEFFCPSWSHNTTTGQIIVTLFDGSTALGQMYLYGSTISTGAGIGAIRVDRRLTPSAASHTYQVKAHTNTGTLTVGAGAGGSATQMPGYIKVWQKGGA